MRLFSFLVFVFIAYFLPPAPTTIFPSVTFSLSLTQFFSCLLHPLIFFLSFSLFSFLLFCLSLSSVLLFLSYLIFAFLYSCSPNPHPRFAFPALSFFHCSSPKSGKGLRGCSSPFAGEACRAAWSSVAGPEPCQQLGWPGLAGDEATQPFSVR